MASQERSERKRGGQPGNTSAFKHGKRSGRRRFTLNSLGSEYQTVLQHVNRLRLALETEAEATYGKLTLRVEDSINAICRYEMVALCANRRVKAKESKDVVGDLKTAAWATQRRSDILKRLLPDSELPGSSMSIYADDDAGDWDGFPDSDPDPAGDAQDRPTSRSTASASKSDSKPESPRDNARNGQDGDDTGDDASGLADDWDDDGQGLGDDDQADADPLADDDDQADDDPAELERDRRRIYGDDDGGDDEIDAGDWDADSI